MVTYKFFYYYKYGFYKYYYVIFLKMRGLGSIHAGLHFNFLQKLLKFELRKISNEKN